MMVGLRNRILDSKISEYQLEAAAKPKGKEKTFENTPFHGCCWKTEESAKQRMRARR